MRTDLHEHLRRLVAEAFLIEEGKLDRYPEKIHLTALIHQLQCGHGPDGFSIQEIEEEIEQVMDEEATLREQYVNKVTFTREGYRNEH